MQYEISWWQGEVVHCDCIAADRETLVTVVQSLRRCPVVGQLYVYELDGDIRSLLSGPQLEAIFDPYGKDEEKEEKKEMSKMEKFQYLYRLEVGPMVLSDVEFVSGEIAPETAQFSQDHRKALLLPISDIMKVKGHLNHDGVTSKLKCTGRMVQKDKKDEKKEYWQIETTTGRAIVKLADVKSIEPYHVIGSCTEVMYTTANTIIRTTQGALFVARHSADVIDEFNKLK